MGKIRKFEIQLKLSIYNFGIYLYSLNLKLKLKLVDDPSSDKLAKGRVFQ